ncbi:MAG: hypothetical protein ACKN9U_24065 [Pirellulaceae bacterium]
MTNRTNCLQRGWSCCLAERSTWRCRLFFSLAARGLDAFGLAVRRCGGLLAVLVLLGASSHALSQPVQQGTDAGATLADLERLERWMRERPQPVSRWVWGSPPEQDGPWRSDSGDWIEGKILDWNADGLIHLIEGDSEIRRLQGDQCAAMEVAWSTLQADEADELYRRGEWLASVRSAQQAMGSGILPWQRRVLATQIVDALVQEGKIDLAVSVWEKLIQERPPLLHYAFMPLVWSRDAITMETPSNAMAWLESDEPSVRLIGAYWLLASRNRQRALEVLQALAKESHPAIRQLASAQQWRVLSASQFAAEKLPEILAARDRMLFPLQEGPTFLIADRLEEADQAVLALYQWQHLVTLHRQTRVAAVAARRWLELLAQTQSKATESTRAWCAQQLPFWKATQGSSIHHDKGE